MNNFDSILRSITTTQQAIELINALEQIRQEAFKLKSNLNTKMEKLLPSTIYQEIVTHCKKQNIQSREELVKFLQKLQSSIQSTPKICLTLSIDPSEVTLKNISKWISSNLPQKVFLEINFEPNLIGGAQIVFNNHFKDYSISKKLENYQYV